MEKRTKYSKSFKLKVVKEVLEGKYTKSEAMLKYNIKGKSAILYWIRAFTGQEEIRKSFKNKIDTFEVMKRTLELADLKAKVKILRKKNE